MAVTATTVAAEAAGVLTRLEADTVDARFAARGDRPEPRDVVVVAIDGEALRRWQWPLRRSLHARAIDTLRRAGARRIAYDVHFGTPTVPREDNALIRSISRARPVVLAESEPGPRGQTSVLGGARNAARHGAVPADSRFATGAGGAIRRVGARLGTTLPSFATAAARAAGAPPTVPNRDGSLVDFAGGPGSVRTVAFGDLLAGRVSPHVVRNRVAVVGVTASALNDLHRTPTTGRQLMAGVEVQAHAVQTLIDGAPLRDTSRGFTAGLVALLAMLTAALSGWKSALRALPIVGAVAALYAGAAHVAFQSGVVLPVVAPLAALVVTAAGAVAVDLTRAVGERRRLRRLFGRFVGDAVVDDVIAAADGDLRLGGRELDATVLFCDLRGFTSFAQDQPASAVIGVLNHYLDEMSSTVLDHGGTVVSYMGDGIMAVFGAPLPQPDHAERALRAAREMLGPALDRVNARLRAHDLHEGFAMGVGLNSGPVMSGNVGSERRVEYAAVGDTTNVAARLEAMTKRTGHPVLVSETTFERLNGARALLRPVGALRLSGRAVPCEAWTTA